MYPIIRFAFFIMEVRFPHEIIADKKPDISMSSFVVYE